MARLPLVDADDPDADPDARRILGAVRANLAKGDLPWRDINVYSAMANHPPALEALLAFGNRVYSRNSLSPAQRELAYLATSVANDCHY